MKFDKLEIGMVVYDVHSHAVGNTTLRSIGVWPVRIKDIDHVRHRALASWNGNAATWLTERSIDKLKAKYPVLIATRFGHRRPTREELAEMRTNSKADKSPAQKEKA